MNEKLFLDLEYQTNEKSKDSIVKFNEEKETLEEFKVEDFSKEYNEFINEATIDGECFGCGKPIKTIVLNLLDENFLYDFWCEECFKEFENEAVCDLSDDDGV